MIINEDTTDLVISPDAIFQAPEDFYMYTQQVYKDTCLGNLIFSNKTDAVLLRIDLAKTNACIIVTWANLSDNTAIHQAPQ